MKKWQMEVFKMAVYVYFPVGLYCIFNTEYIQEKYYYPYLKNVNPALYRKLTGDDELER